MTLQFGRDRLPWSQAVWDSIDRAVHDEANRVRVGRKFLPLYGPLGNNTQTVPLQTLKAPTAGDPLKSGTSQYLVPLEVYKEFQIPRSQIEDSGFATTMAVKAANLVATAEDEVLIKGWKPNPGIKNADIAERESNSVLAGLEKATDSKGSNDKEELFEELISAIAHLRTAGHHGPFALVVSPAAFAKEQRPIGNTSVPRSEPIKSLVTEGFYSSSAISDDTKGVLVSVGAGSVDLAVTQDITTEFINEGKEYTLRVFERFVLRINDPGAVRTLNFIEKKEDNPKKES